MFQLPPPPRFTLPPPPMFPTDILDSKTLLQLTCSSIRQQQQLQINPQLILISCFIFLIIAILLTLSFIWIQSYHRRKSVPNKLDFQIPKDLSICSSRSYETISSGIYLESINTSATTLSTNPSSISHYERSSPPLYHEILPC